MRGLPQLVSPPVASNVLPMFHPNLNLVASCTAVLIPIESSALADVLYDGYIVAGCETDVCVLQSCLGLLSLGYEVYVVEELLFSSSRNVDSAIARMKAEGAIFLTYKTLYHELVESVENDRHTEKSLETLNLPDDLPDSAVQWP